MDSGSIEPTSLELDNSVLRGTDSTRTEGQKDEYL